MSTSETSRPRARWRAGRRSRDRRTHGRCTCTGRARRCSRFCIRARIPASARRCSCARRSAGKTCVAIASAATGRGSWRGPGTRHCASTFPAAATARAHRPTPGSWTRGHEPSRRRRGGSRRPQTPSGWRRSASASAAWWRAERRLTARRSRSSSCGRCRRAAARCCANCGRSRRSRSRTTPTRMGRGRRPGPQTTGP